jgi:hypothetical protein
LKNLKTDLVLKRHFRPVGKKDSFESEFEFKGSLHFTILIPNLDHCDNQTREMLTCGKILQVIPQKGCLSALFKEKCVLLIKMGHLTGAN